ncbi:MULTISPECIES: glycoside hydrolase family 15 protein [unclassified Leptolyngbya]|uniref:glycoside hydrolase family 15 protein n=1 Tax=unclassified Leptolyngbya TaxID=2650499 RepID=UPI001687F277|nr:MULTISPECIES: glycoside hydrolase family 15 protein [unclassified Leptolyngbya]MBD1911247.1 glycoside hydrolase family 15 protein [Leptolyngbya sp. FACHB-8]MBD2155494.1 glycoside hydrolase family 15 protein [Leptolyngbya sp. FACHB-16]
MLPTLTPEPLNHYYQEIKDIILARQNPISGLIPASTAVTVHGNYTDAWVRDNVYSILAVWGLALAYRKAGIDDGRAYELEHSVVKLMRGLLFAMMRQAPKVEKFKQTQHPLDALHAKYDLKTGDTVVDDTEWGHLQLDATSIYILILAQMTASGLPIVYTLDEVNFIQNLVYYIGRAYRTPDYGIWERGEKINHGNPELNASSVGMAKAALEAISGLDLFGVRGSQASVIHVLPDEIARARMTLESLLPRESASKEVDAAVLSVIGFPAFAVEDLTLVERTHQQIVSKLQGHYGCKRFLRDGHQTVLEDITRLHYEPTELKKFEHIECEWPLFFTYLLLNSLFRGDRTQAEDYRLRLDALRVEQGGHKLLPELYYVPEEAIAAERATPHSQTRLPNDNIPLVWAQSLYLLGRLLQDGWIAPGDLDPLSRHLKLGQSPRPQVQVCLLAEDEELQAQLAAFGIATQTPSQVAPVQIRRSKELSQVYEQIGRNDKLNLSGRPIRRLRGLTTSRIFRVRGETIAVLPSFLDQSQFYLTFDYHFLVDQIRGELAYIWRHWNQLGRPTMTLLLTHDMMQDQSSLLELFKEMQGGKCGNVPVRLGRLQELLLMSGMERIDFIHDFEFPQSPLSDARKQPYYLPFFPDSTQQLTLSQEFTLELETDPASLLERLRRSVNLYEQIEVLEALLRLESLSFDTGFGGPGKKVTVGNLLQEVYLKASQLRLWAVIRRAAGLLRKVDVNLSDAVTDILVRQKQIAVGKSYSENSLITDPMSTVEIVNKIEEFVRQDIRDRPLTQEILVYLSILIKTDPHLFRGFLTLRVGYLILLITSDLAQELNVTQDEAYEHLMQLSPFEVKSRLYKVLAGYETINQMLVQQESLTARQQQDVQWVVTSEAEATIPTDISSWRQKRQREGSLNRVPKNFYPKVWQVLKHCGGLVIGDKLDRRNRLEQELTLEMTPGEKKFALRVEHLLNKIQAPEYRQINIEALMELAALFEQNPDFQIEQSIVLDVFIGHAVRLAWLDQHPEDGDRYDERKANAWSAFYEVSPYDCARFMAEALRFLTELNQSEDEGALAQQPQPAEAT